jgi:hypothetical protein
MSLNPNAVIVANKLKGAGYTKAQIAGVLGNFELESGFNPRVNEGGKVGAPMGVGGYGFGQWTGGRQTGLVNFAKQQKMDPGDPNLQAKFLLYELDGPEKKAAAYLREAVSPEESARRFLTNFERAGIPKTKQRQEAARVIYGKLGFLDQPGQATTPPAITPVATESPSSKGNALGSELLRQIMGMIPAMRQKRSSLPDMFDPSLGEIGMPRTPVPADFLHLFMDKEVTG